MLRDRKTNMLTLSGFSEDLNGVTMLPAALNTRSDGVTYIFLPLLTEEGIEPDYPATILNSKDIEKKLA